MRFLTVLIILCLLATGLAIAQSPGDYDGTWKSDQSGDSGKLHVSLKKTGAIWDSTLYFTLQDGQVNATTKSTKVEGTKLTIAFQYESDGMTMKATVTGEWSGNTLQGKYQSRTSDGATVDTGTWNATRAE